MMLNQFKSWLGLKEKLDQQIHQAPYVKESELWWASLGKNIGREINGKSSKFTRPVVVLKKLSRNLFLVVPVTTQSRTGTWFCPISVKQKTQIACLNQIRVIDSRRLHSKLYRLYKQDMDLLKMMFWNLYR